MNTTEYSQIGTDGNYVTSQKEQKNVDEFQMELYLHVKSLVNKHFPVVSLLDEKGKVKLDNRIWNNSNRLANDFFEMVDMYRERK